MRGQLEFRVKHFEGSGSRVIFIFGFGCNLEQPGLRWCLERFMKEELDLTCIQLPTDITDFQTEVISRCEDIQEAAGDNVTLGFSYGGLALSFLNGSRRRIFIAPFWEVNERWMKKGGHALAAFLSLAHGPGLKRKFYTRDAGPLAVDEDLEGMPDRISFSSVHQFFQAQKDLPPPKRNDIIFYGSDDIVVSTRAMEERINRFGLESRRFAGGHIFYLENNREEIIDMILHEVKSSFGG
ncbi:MAG: hypothetical protein ACMUHB_01930 [Thermoplasmatota archaeon]